MSEKKPQSEFEELMRGVTPLKGKKSVQRKEPKPLVIRERPPAPEPLRPAAKFHGVPTQKRKAPRLKIDRKFEPDRVVDLHGLFREPAEEKAELEIARSIRQGDSSLLLITGKGLNSPDGAVLKDAIWNLLCDFDDSHIHDFDWAPKHLGGEGAILVIFY